MGTRRFSLTVLWAAVAPYLLEQLRCLQSSFPVDVHLITRQPPRDLNSPYETEVLRGIRTTLLSENDLFDSDRVREAVGSPHGALLVCGWNNPAFRQNALTWPMSTGPVIMSLDTNYAGTLRQRVARFRHPVFFRRVDTAYVPGVAGSRMAGALGFTPDAVRSGVYSVSCDIFARSSEEFRLQNPNRQRKFLYVGRLIERKGVDVLLRAYAEYRRTSKDPWMLDLAGQGDLESVASGQVGVNVRGFVQPGDLPRIYAEATAFVLPSRYEPWGVVLAEAAASSLPVITSSAVGARHDLVVDGVNGLVVPVDDPGALSRAMTVVARASDKDLHAMGEVSSLLSKRVDAGQSASTLFAMIAAQ